MENINTNENQYVRFITISQKFDNKIKSVKEGEFLKLIESELNVRKDFKKKFNKIKNKLFIALSLLYKNETSEGRKLNLKLFSMLVNAKTSSELFEFSEMVLAYMDEYNLK